MKKNEAPRYCGYIALVGLPNAGKSTLLNAAIKTKIAGVSKRPQTTRNRILGLDTVGQHQLIFVDTPGMQNQHRQSQMNKAMHEVVWTSISEADVICYLIDVTKGWSQQDHDQLRKMLSGAPQPLLVLASKSDSVKKHVLAEKTRKITAGMAALVAEIAAETPEGEARTHPCFSSPEPYLFSSKRPESVAELKKKLASYLPEGPWLFDEDAITDSSEQFIFAELIREQLFRKLSDEIPFGCGVVVEKITPGPVLAINATIIVENESHKKIVIGHRGEAIKVIGTLARQSIEQYFKGEDEEGQKVFLELFVRVEKGWTNKQEFVQSIQKLEG